MARFVTLASSSSGNCIYVGTATDGILIDAGISAKQICDRLNKLGIAPESIRAIFVTHEHDDHVKGLRVFSEKYNLPVYATGGTFAALLNSGKLSEKMRCEHIKQNPTVIGDINVHAFRTSHDAKQSCGYIIELPDRKVGICTDNGCMTDTKISMLSDCDLCLIESNYDEDMLRNGPYSPSLKHRILSEEGHMSNDLCAETVSVLLNAGKCRRFILGHLSEHNNRPELAFSCTNSRLKHMGYVKDFDYTLDVAPRDCMKNTVIF